MKKKFEILFLLSVVVNLVGIYTSNKTVTNFSKPFILLFLLFFFIDQSTSNKYKISTQTIGAMCCSLIGDVLLIFEPNNPLFFIGGLISFFIAHFFYAMVFYTIIKTKKATLNWKVLPFVLLYYISLVVLLFPYLGDLQIPVVLYGFIISTMLLLALQFLFVQQTSFLISIGAIFFVLSDTLLAINKFYYPFTYASIFIILTYAFAQYLIIKGLLATKQQQAN